MIPHIDHPCPPYVVSFNGFNGPPSVSGQRKHAADDFSQDEKGDRMPSGADLLMPMETGIVTIAGWVDGNTGFMIAVYDAESGLQCRMLHLKDVLVGIAQRPNPRQLIGHCNSTGLSYGTHLHFACWFDTFEQARQVQADPEPVYGKWAVDPQLLLRKQEEEDVFGVMTANNGAPLALGWTPEGGFRRINYADLVIAEKAKQDGALRRVDVSVDPPVMQAAIDSAQ